MSQVGSTFFESQCRHHCSTLVEKTFIYQPDNISFTRFKCEKITIPIVRFYCETASAYATPVISHIDAAAATAGCKCRGLPILLTRRGGGRGDGKADRAMENTETLQGYLNRQSSYNLSILETLCTKSEVCDRMQIFKFLF